mmetsp:Transcript_98521/g.195424  ORF Transcript_98521/g.195424 Transcript_98521/m.195424 type:complete len:496 (-) Transcript_98521:252-1739(-)
MAAALAAAIGSDRRGGASPSSPPPTWRGFSSVEEYKAFLKDPGRIVRLEWRKVALRKHRGLVSHSWLLAHLFDSRCLRLELFADTGLTEKMLLAGKDRAGGTLYDDRAAGAQDFVRPLTAERLRQIAEEVSNLQPYSVTDWNCHHFVLNIWNSVVIEMLRCSHYPDRVKTGMLRGALESLGSLVGGGAHLAAQLGIQEHETEVSEAGLLFGSVASMVEEVPPEDPGDPTTRIRVLSWHEEEGDRIYGELSVPGLEAWAADPPGQIARFTQALRRGSVLLLEPHCKLKTLVEAGSSAGRTAKPGKGPGSRLCVDAWARARDWLPDDDGEVAMRLAAQVGLLDEVADSVQRAVASPVAARELPRTMVRSGTLTSLLGSTTFGRWEEGHFPDMPGASDDCSIILRGSEVRLAMYVVLGEKQTLQGSGCSGMQMRSPKKLWLLSGDARAGQEGSFTFVLQDIALRDLPISAQCLALRDLESLQFALATGDWGSQHRDAL